MKKNNILSQISTKPNPDSMKWAGKQRSILATILLWGMWVCRVASLLQIAKFIFRKIALTVKKATTDKKATRVNVPPMFCEIYFILWFILLLTIHLLGIQNWITNALIAYYLFESIVWVLYYTVFRRFFEEHYAIYHELEYLTVLILIIPTQALGFATLYHDTFKNTISSLLGAGSDTTPFSIKVLSALFGAIVISMIISAFPTERIKKAYNKSKAIVIGGGDVVSQRLYPALKNAEKPFGKIEVLDLESFPQKLPYAHYFENTEALSSHLQTTIDNHTVVWIETPTNTHASYLRLLLQSRAQLIVLEKPIAYSKEDIAFVKSIITDEANRNRIFFLSYYMLEKALPLNMLLSYNEKYEKYLDIENKYLAKNWRLAIGSFEGAEVVIHEGKDYREWVSAEGGHLYETFLHNVLIASLIAGKPTSWDNITLIQADEKEVASIELFASIMGAPIKLSQKKGVSNADKCRYVRFKFSEGHLECDLEMQAAKVHLTRLGQTISITIKDTYNRKYSVMTDLVMRCYNGEILPHDVDGLENQIETLEWLSGLESTK